MLKYRIKAEDSETVNYSNIDIQRDTLNISSDSNYVYGTFNQSYNIKDGDVCSVLTPFISSYVDLPTECENVTRSGFFERLEAFPIESVTEQISDEELVPLSTVKTVNLLTSVGGSVAMYKLNYVTVTRRYVRMPNGNIYYEHYSSSKESIYGDSLLDYYEIKDCDGKIIYKGTDGYFNLDFYDCLDKDGNTLTADTTTLPMSALTLYSYIKYYVDNDTVTFNGEDFSFTENYYYSGGSSNDDIYMDIVTDEDGIVTLGNYTAYDPCLHLTRFTVKKPSDILLSINQLLSAKEYFYINYKGEKYDVNFIDGYWQVTVPIVTIEQHEEIDECTKCKTIYTTSSTTYSTYILERYNKEDILGYNYKEDIDNYQKYFTINGSLVPIMSEYRVSENGDYVFVYSDSNYSLNTDSIITVAVENDEDIILNILKDINGKFYVNYGNKRYYLEDDPQVKEVWKHSCSTSAISGTWHYTISRYSSCNNTSEYYDTIYDEFDVSMSVSEFIKMASGVDEFRVSYTDEDGNETLWQVKQPSDDEKRYLASKVGTIVNYDGTSAETQGNVIKYNYKFNAYRCLVLNGKTFYANISNNIYNSDNEIDYTIAIRDSKQVYDLEIVGAMGSGLICHPIINPIPYWYEMQFKDGEDVNSVAEIIDRPYREIVQVITNQNNVLEYFIKDTTFGKPIEPWTSVFNDQTIFDTDSFKLYKQVNYISFPIRLGGQIATNLMQEDIVNNEFVNVESEKAINPIIDMEKDIYIPKIQDKDGNFSDVYQIKFNLHFRTRDDNWKIKDSVFGQISDNNWNIMDAYSVYTSGITSGAVASSDLLYFLNFTEDDVYYQKSKIGKSFLRLSFYDSTDPNTQNLMHSSTIFLDENAIYAKYIRNINKDASTTDTYKAYTNIASGNNTTYCNVNSEPVGRKTSHVIDYSKDRLDASFIVESRDNTETSSEGYYIYMFRDYGTKLRPSPLFMKVEFNHAGEGKTLPFFMPTVYNDVAKGSGFTCMAKDYNSYELTNELSSGNTKGLKEFKLGLSLKDVLISQYIRLEVKYIEETHQYIYYIPNTYCKAKSWENNTMTFNLWEIKIKDES